MRNKVNMDQVGSYGALHNEWSDRILSASRLIRSDELDVRARAGAYVIFLATVCRDESVTYALLRGAPDVEGWLVAWLRRKDPPSAHLPPMDTMSELARSPGGGRLSFEALNEALQKNV